MSHRGGSDTRRTGHTRVRTTAPTVASDARLIVTAHHGGRTRRTSLLQSVQLLKTGLKRLQSTRGRSLASTTGFTTGRRCASRKPLSSELNQTSRVPRDGLLLTDGDHTTTLTETMSGKQHSESLERKLKMRQFQIKMFEIQAAAKFVNAVH